MSNFRWQSGTKFQLTHLLRDATRHGISTTLNRFYFNSRISCEMRRNPQSQNVNRWHFNSRISCEMRPSNSFSFSSDSSFQLTHLLRDATTYLPLRIYPQAISTHASLARCDEDGLWSGVLVVDFNSRISCEMRPTRQRILRVTCKFQLTHLLRDATMEAIKRHVRESISTHASLARCDESARGNYEQLQISTHASLARCDLLPTPINCFVMYFNSRISCEMRHIYCAFSHLLQYFNSRISCEMRPPILNLLSNSQRISTHASLARCDPSSRPTAPTTIEFQLTHLLRDATS